jgi:hypothetical protein
MNLVLVPTQNWGALAEIFLEEFYHREALIITTHYSNLKILANELLLQPMLI